MNITYIVGFIGALAVMIVGMMFGSDPASGSFKLLPGQITNFIDPASVFITIGCTIFIVVACFPGGTLASIPKHFAIMLNTKKIGRASCRERV